jgi:ribosomal protein L11
MNPELDELYVQARRVLLDGLEALGEQRRSVIVAGAQAIYLQAGAGSLPIADTTSDGDLALDPELLTDEPTLAGLMEAKGFRLQLLGGAPEPGIWEAPAVIVNGAEVRIPVDLIVPAGVAPPGGNRGARLGNHGKKAARKAKGLEAALVDNQRRRVEALDPTDTRAIEVRVAGPSALLVAKTHKIADRVRSGRDDRLADKDASDVLRLTQRFAPEQLAPVLERLLDDPVASGPTAEALEAFQELFGVTGGRGIAMASTALRTAVPAERVRALFLAYAHALSALTA